MQVYLVEINNCEAYEDYYTRIEKVFTSFRGASEWLVDEGFEPFYYSFLGKGDVRFYREDSEDDGRCEEARIIEMDVVIA